tara:strand:+ start:380 stop:937 length:558 start_codon:yes stop_codon:yes gene_type:complete
MIKRFELKKIFTEQQLKDLIKDFEFLETAHSLERSIQNAFSDYIINALSEMSGSTDEHKRLYIEAVYYLQKSQKLLEDLPHPAGKMANRLSTMVTTLNKLASDQQNISAERANRFIEKNLIRRLRHVWECNTEVMFFDVSSEHRFSSREYLIRCLNAAGRHYPEISWLARADYKSVDSLIRSIKR